MFARFTREKRTHQYNWRHKDGWWFSWVSKGRTRRSCSWNEMRIKLRMLWTETETKKSNNTNLISTREAFKSWLWCINTCRHQHWRPFIQKNLKNNANETNNEHAERKELKNNNAAQWVSHERSRKHKRNSKKHSTISRWICIMWRRVKKSWPTNLDCSWECSKLPSSLSHSHTRSVVLLKNRKWSWKFFDFVVDFNLLLVWHDFLILP